MPLFLLLAFQIVNAEIWDLVTKTCDKSGAGSDAAVFAKVIYDNTEEQIVSLNTIRDDFERSQKDHFRLDLKRHDIDLFGVFWWPAGSIGEPLCLDWAMLMNSKRDACYVMMFRTWISHYENPPTYPEVKQKMDFRSCISFPH